MGKGTTTTTPIIPPELSGLYRNTANQIVQGQNRLPLLGRGMAGPVYGGGGNKPGPDGGKPPRAPVEDPINGIDPYEVDPWKANW